MTFKQDGSSSWGLTPRIICQPKSLNLSLQLQALASVRNHSALLNSALYNADPSLPCFGAEFRISRLALHLQTNTPPWYRYVTNCLASPDLSGLLLPTGWPGLFSDSALGIWYPGIHNDHHEINTDRCLGSVAFRNAVQITWIRAALAQYNTYYNTISSTAQSPLHKTTTNLINSPLLACSNELIDDVKPVKIHTE